MKLREPYAVLQNLVWIHCCFKWCQMYLPKECLCPRQEVVNNHQHLPLPLLWNDPNLKSGPESFCLNLFLVPSCQDRGLKHLQGEMKPCFYCQKSQASSLHLPSSYFLCCSSSTVAIPSFIWLWSQTFVTAFIFVNVLLFSCVSFLMQRSMFLFSCISLTLHCTISTRLHFSEGAGPSPYPSSTRSTKVSLQPKTQIVGSIVRSQIWTESAAILEDVIATAEAEDFILCCVIVICG